MSVRLDPAYRDAALHSLAHNEFDVVVVGGGVVGAGAALDAAARGLSVALVEARDWAAGTSSRSSKLIHGGLRYLEQRDFGLVREALKERSLLLHRLAPHLVRPVPFLFPLRHKGWERAYIGAGVALYDSIGGARALPVHRHLSHRKALELAPALRPESLTGAIRYYDAQVDDARLTMMIARTAAQHGATVCTRVRATGLLRDGRAVVGVRVRDIPGGHEHLVRARRVISATGVWTDDDWALDPGEAPFHIQMSKGVHILVPRERLRLNTGLIMRTEKSVLLVIPWSRYWIIGTTDTPWPFDRDRPAATQADLDYLLGHVNEMLRDPLSEQDVVGVYAGLRPLLSGRSAETTKLSREHAVAEPVPGFFVVAGGKYTTYRVMAADVVDAAAAGLGAAVAPSLTRHLPIHGAVGYRELWRDRSALAAGVGLPVPTVERLLGRYGSAVGDLVEMIRQDRSLAAPLAGADGYLAAEIVYAVTHEGALDLDDVLSRRTRIAIEYPDRGLDAAVEVAGLVGGRLGWDRAARAAAVEAYREQTAAELSGRRALPMLPR
ncbi:glycerol-3-phosphate dehydrogenase/oxidase [Actinophytocola sp.]|uniref:glycerol-3-phosphate dehydrogenase/oxidase n=1 Tax=Actinophytocola sp. TaxID=1872138 RepID=UPI002D806148|nr:glycerol-3-phosphate dehydrogenase/oxidase [Actinophytocola sp.]HET9141838.1 glycerol-3-phosphate dehydrogenase/oxidase [Actinophytocola sp.]